MTSEGQNSREPFEITFPIILLIAFVFSVGIIAIALLFQKNPGELSFLNYLRIGTYERFIEQYTDLNNFYAAFMVAVAFIHIIVGHTMRQYLMKHYLQYCEEIGIHTTSWVIGAWPWHIGFYFRGHKEIKSRFVNVCRYILASTYVLVIFAFYKVFLEGSLLFGIVLYSIVRLGNGLLFRIFRPFYELKQNWDYPENNKK